jgi:hypothetical protein
MKKIFFPFALTFLFYSCRENVEVNTPTPEKNSLGASLATPAQLAKVNEIPQLSLGTALPQSYFLEMPPVGNQGKTGTCTSWATAYGGMGFLKNKQNGLNYSSNKNLYSPSFVYNQISSNCQRGSTYPENFEILMNQGVCSLAEMPFNENSCGTKPNSSQVNAAIQNKIVKWEQVRYDDIKNIKTILTTGKPVFIMAQIDQSFDELTSPFILNSIGGQNRGLHSMVISGYDDAKGAFKIQNSWGRQWGDNGSLWITYGIWPLVIVEAYYMEFAISKPTDNVKSGLVMHLPFDGNVNDFSGNNNLVIPKVFSNGILRYVSDRFGLSNKAIELGGTKNPAWLEVSSSTSLNFSSSFSFSTWLKINEEDGLNGTDNFLYRAIFWKGLKNVSSISSGFNIYKKNTTDTKYSQIQVDFLATPKPTNGTFGFQYLVNSNKSDIGNWVHIAFTYSNGIIRLFKNGTLLFKLDKMNYNLAAGNSHRLLIGADIGNAFFNGAFDDFRMYNRELTESEVQKLYLQ